MTQESISHPNSVPYASPEQDALGIHALGPGLTSRNMFCLHGIAADDLGINSLVPANTSLEERFRVAVIDRPALSTVVHTQRATTSKAPLWSSVGVVIGDGSIQAAKPRDMSSVMLEHGKRQTIEQSPEEAQDALDKIASNDAKYPDYPLDNEVVVSQPTVAGLYFKDTAGLMPNQINTNHVTADPNTVPELIRKVGTQFGLPIYAVRTSGVYEVREYDQDTGKYRLSLETAPRVQAAEVASRQPPGLKPSVVQLP
jgi:hypothetical protein